MNIFKTVVRKGAGFLVIAVSGSGLLVGFLATLFAIAPFLRETEQSTLELLGGTVLGIGSIAVLIAVSIPVMSFVIAKVIKYDAMPGL